jgi:hypothetical protein
MRGSLEERRPFNPKFRPSEREWARDKADEWSRNGTKTDHSSSALDVILEGGAIVLRCLTDIGIPGPPSRVQIENRR